MPQQISWPEFGIVGAVLTFIITIFFKLPDVIKAVKKSKEGDFEGESLKIIIENNNRAMEKQAQATNELILYLKTRDAGSDAEREQQSKQLDRIEEKLDKHIEEFRDHYNKCNIKCLGG